MTSSSACAERLAALLLAAALVGCAGEHVIETQAIVLAETERCELAVRGGLMINSYRATLYEELAPPTDPAMPGCFACVTEGRCAPVAEGCICDQARPPVTAAINAALAPLRFEDLDPDVRYCILLRAYAEPGASRPEPQSCACEPLATAPTRACGVSLFPATVGENSSAFIIGMECRPCPGLDPL